MAVRYLDVFLAVAAGFLFLLLYLLFRDPHREIPAAPLGVVSPVDGKVIAVESVEQGVLHGPAHRIRIQINSLGAYTARAPVEGRDRQARSQHQLMADDLCLGRNFFERRQTKFGESHEPYLKLYRPSL